MASPEPSPISPKKANSSLLWVVLIIFIIAAAVIVYLIWQGGNTVKTNSSNTNTQLNGNSLNSNSQVNGNVNARNNTNANANVNDANHNVNGVVSNVNMASWKSYSNDKYHFGLKYPSTWTYQLYTTDYNSEGQYVLVFTTKRSSPESLPFLSVKENWSADQEATSINKADPPYTSVTSTEDITIGSFPAKKLTYSSTIGLTLEKMVIAVGSMTYIFGSTSSDTDFESVAASLTISN